MILENTDGALTIAPRNDFPTNRGGLCRKGWTSVELINHPQRLTTPLMRDRKGGALRVATWAEALDFTAAQFSRIQEQHGRDAVAVFGGGGLTNEKAYTLGKFARVALRTANIDYNGRFCMSSAAAAGIKAFGIDRGLPFPLEDVQDAGCILLVGSNMAETMPPIMQHFEEQKRRGGTLIVVDPRSTPTARAAALHLQPTPGTDLALANGLLHVAMADGLIDHNFIAERTQGFDGVRRVIASYWPDRVERITGVPAASLSRAAHMLGEAATAMVLTARGAEQHSKGVDTTLALINLALALGKAGRPHCGYGCLTGQGNGQGGREHGQKADQLPGYRKIADPAHREFVAGVWGISPDELPGPGKSAFELLDSLGQDGGPKALLLMGSNPLISTPDAGRIESRIRSLDFMAVSEIFLSETAALADVVFPCAQWAEEEGTMTNLEGRVIRRMRAIDPPEGVRSDLDLMKGLADRMGRGQFFSTDPKAVFNELGRASAGGVADYSGITYERIEAEDGMFWPSPAGASGGTPRMFLKEFGTEDGKARFHAVAHRPSAEEPDDEYPLYLTTGRVMAQYQSGTQTRRVAALNEAAPGPFVELHPELARRLGVSDGAPVRVRTRRGSSVVPARLTPTIRPDTIFMPFHWPGKGRSNLLTNPALDPTSKMPEFKVCAACIETSASPPQPLPSSRDGTLLPQGEGLSD